MKKRGFTLVELVILIALLLIIGALVASCVSKNRCKNGETVKDTDGSMDCWGGDTYKHCEPSTHFVCHDQD